VYEALAFYLLIRKDRGSTTFGPDSIPVTDIMRKLDTDFFSGRWVGATDQQRDLLSVVSCLTNCEDVFSIDEIASLLRDRAQKPLSRSRINQLLSKLADRELVYKNRHGRECHELRPGTVA
jgi:hypothetical protein